MSDRFAVMHAGEIEQVGTPRDVYDSPTSTYVAEFLGLANLFPARVTTPGTIKISGRSIAGPTGDVTGDCTAFVRPERIRFTSVDDGVVAGSVTDVVFIGATTQIRVDVSGHELQVVVANDGAMTVPKPGTQVGIEIPPDAVRVLQR